MYGYVSPPIEGHILQPKLSPGNLSLTLFLYLMHKHTFTAAMYCLSNLRSLPFASNIASAYTSGSGKGGRQPSYKPTGGQKRTDYSICQSTNHSFVYPHYTHIPFPSFVSLSFTKPGFGGVRLFKMFASVMSQKCVVGYCMLETCKRTVIMNTFNLSE